MATTIGRFITIAAAAPDLLEKADKAGPSIRKLLALGLEAAKLMKDPAMAEFVKSAQQLVTDLDLGGDIPPAEVVTPKEAMKRIVEGDITAEQQRALDHGSQSSGGVG